MVTDGQSQTAGNVAGEVPDGLSCLPKFPEDALGTGKQFAAGLGQIDSAGNAVEKPATQVLFQQRDSLADGRLSDMDPFRGGGKGAALGYGEERFQKLCVHGGILPDSVLELNI